MSTLKNKSGVFKDGMGEKELKVYELYMDRLNKENEMYWNRFKIYIGLNTGLFAVIGYLVKAFLSGDLDFSWFAMFVAFISIIGLPLSVSWRFISRDGIHWQNVMNKNLSNWEKMLFNDSSIGLYSIILKSESPKDDIVKVNLKTVNVFILGWIILAFFSIMEVIPLVIKQFQ